MNPIVYVARICAAGITLGAGIFLSHHIATQPNQSALTSHTAGSIDSEPVTFIASDPNDAFDALKAGALAAGDPVDGEVNAELATAIDHAIQALSVYSDTHASQDLDESAQALIDVLGSDPVTVSAALGQLNNDASANNSNTGTSSDGSIDGSDTDTKSELDASNQDTTDEAVFAESGSTESGSTESGSTEGNSSGKDSEEVAKTSTTEGSSTALGASAGSNDDDSAENASEPSTVALPKDQAQLATQIMDTVKTLKSVQEDWALPTVSIDSSVIDVDTVLLAAAHQFDSSALGYENGKIPADKLCGIVTAPGQNLRCDAALAFHLLNKDFKEEFGADIGITDSYRSYESQVRVKAAKGFLAATPGHSNHGWGQALDLNGAIAKFGTAERAWMVEHAPDYGWIAPDWAKENGSKPEPWHYEFEGAPSPSADSPTWTFYDSADLSEVEAVLSNYNLDLPARPTDAVDS